MSKGLTVSAHSPSSSWAPVFSRQHQDAVAGVDRRRLLGDEVHAVEERVDHQQVEVLVAGDRLVEVLVDAEVDRHPVGGPVAVVDDRDQRLDPLQVLLVLGDVLPRGLQVGDEGDPLVELRVVGEELVEGGEPAEHVLGQVGAVDADDQVLAAAGEQLALVVGDLVDGGDPPQALGVDPERIGADPDLAVPVVDDARCGSRPRSRPARGSSRGSCGRRSSCGSR